MSHWPNCLHYRKQHQEIVTVWHCLFARLVGFIKQYRRQLIVILCTTILPNISDLLLVITPALVVGHWATASTDHYWYLYIFVQCTCIVCFTDALLVHWTVLHEATADCFSLTCFSICKSVVQPQCWRLLRCGCSMHISLITSTESIIGRGLDGYITCPTKEFHCVI